ncbi:hypothetical protein AC1031_007259 [Aphanomyces cochlioides]|nr:hypothetical protein AC1031_007259 [Aphanomyces cochlioides]
MAADPFTDEPMAPTEKVARRPSMKDIQMETFFMGENIVRSIMPHKMVLIMVGLPARGKSFVVRKMTKYTQWLGFSTRIFNAGDYRRQASLKGASAAFFDASNADAKKLRDDLAMAAVNHLIEWLLEGGEVAVLDATNTTKERRALVWEKIKSVQNVSIQVMHIELVCDDPQLLEANYLRKLKNEDYIGVEPEVALNDFKQRVEKYEKVYETLEDSENDGEVCYCKVYNAGEKVLARRCQTFLASQFVSFLQVFRASTIPGLNACHRISMSTLERFGSYDLARIIMGCVVSWAVTKSSLKKAMRLVVHWANLWRKPSAKIRAVSMCGQVP